jgi:hypothetical protein
VDPLDVVDGIEEAGDLLPGVVEVLFVVTRRYSKLPPSL